MKMRIAGPAVMATAFAALTGAGPAPAAVPDGVRSCNTLVYANGPVYVTSARNMTCRAAKREQARYEWTGKNRFTTPGGFTCRPSGRGAVGFQIRCVKDAKAYRIEFAD